MTIPRHLFFYLAFQPLLTLMALAMGAVTMATGMRHKDLLMAFSAAGQHSWARGCTATLHIAQSLEMGRKDFPPVLIQKLRFKLLDDG